MKKYLVDEFNYICFPLSFNEKLEILSPFLKVKSIIGTGFKSLEEKKENVEWHLDTHKLFDKEFKIKNLKIIFFSYYYILKEKEKYYQNLLFYALVNFLKLFIEKLFLK